MRAQASDGDFDYVVVGSGAGGGTVAARLAESRLQGAACSRPAAIRARSRGGARGMGDANRLPDDYDVPAFHPFASENEALRWDFFVRHYADDAQSAARPEVPARPDGGVLYPRAGHARRLHRAQRDDPGLPARGGLGRGSRSAPATPSWSAANMQGYFRRLERCRHRPVQAGAGRARHRPDRPRLGRLAADREGAAPRRLPRPDS